MYLSEVNGIAQNVENVSVGVESDGGEEGLVLLEVSVKVGNYVGHMVVLSARARGRGNIYTPLYYTTERGLCQEISTRRYGMRTEYEPKIHPVFRPPSPRPP